MTPFRNLSIGRKLSLSITLTSCISLLVACGAFALYDLLSFRESMVEELADLAEIVGSACAPAVAAADEQAVGEAVVNVASDPRILAAYVLSRQGKALGGYVRSDTEPARFPAAEPPGHRFTDGSLVLFHQIFLDGEPVGTLYLKSDTRQMWDRAIRYGQVVALILAVALLVTLVISLHLQRLIAQPIFALADAARAVSLHGNYGVRVPPAGGDELGVLTQAFNKMLTEIGSRDAELRAAHEKLKRFAARQTQAVIDEASGREHAEEALRESEEQLRHAQKMEAIGRLAGGVAHDFNNLLTIINGYSQISLERLEDGHPLAPKLTEILNAGQRASGLTRQLLAFSRKQVLRPEVLSINAVVENMEKMLRRLIGEDVELATRLARNVGHIKADRGQLEQVIMNLAVNARDAMPSGGRLTLLTYGVDVDPAGMTIERLTGNASHVLLELCDTGFGMDEATAARIFEPFFTTKGEGKGTGLGLSTVYGIVIQSGGSIGVTSRPGEGATFRILFPRATETLAEVEAAVPRVEAPRGNETILLVEDETPVRELTRGILEERGYAVLSAPDGDQALSLSRSHSGPIHLMLTDVVMPNMNGRELHDRLEPLRPEMKVLYMSGYTDHAIVDKGVLEPGLAFLPKPFTPDGLAGKVRETLDGAIDATSA